MSNAASGHDAPFEGEGSGRSHCDGIQSVFYSSISESGRDDRQLDDSFVAYIVQRLYDVCFSAIRELAPVLQALISIGDLVCNMSGIVPHLSPVQFFGMKDRFASQRYEGESRVKKAACGVSKSVTADRHSQLQLYDLKVQHTTARYKKPPGMLRGAEEGQATPRRRPASSLKNATQQSRQWT